jgi:hypothetical protein
MCGRIDSKAESPMISGIRRPTISSVLLPRKSAHARLTNALAEVAGALSDQDRGVVGDVLELGVP